MKVNPSNDTVRARALHLLSRREHSRHELFQKLIQRGFAAQAIEPVLDELEQKTWLSDSRFAENMLRYRAEKGFGPVRIRFELRDKGVSESIIHDVFQQQSIDWFEQALKLWKKKYNQIPLSQNDRAKQQRYFSYRGFDSHYLTRIYQLVADELELPLKGKQ